MDFRSGVSGRVLTAVARRGPEEVLFRRAAQAGHDLCDLRVGFLI